MSSLKDVNSDKCWSCYHLIAEPKGNRASCGALSNSHGASYKVATYTIEVGKTTSGKSMYAPKTSPLMP